ncbi:MAG: hypothetical protein HYS46_07380 [Betaproteobacteria bacterium]|nr:hypothetical protein [Betaproteobacteria bacterium]
MKRALQHGFGIVTLSLSFAVAAQAQNAVFDNLVQSKFVHCAFYQAYEVDRASGDLVLVEGRSQSLTYFQGIEGEQARQITTRMAGARDVRMARTAKYLHFIDHVAGMYVLTTVYDCIDRDRRGVCMTYGAMQSRHFDPKVLSDPDAVYEALKDSSDPGFCDHSFIGVQEASTGGR